MYRVTRVHRTGLAISRGVGSSQQGSAELWSRLEGEEVRGLTSWAVPVDRTGTASVEAVKAQPILGMKKPPRRVAKRFWDRFVAVPGRKAKKPAGLQTRPAWWWKDRLGVKPGVCRSDTGCQAWHPLPCRP